MGIRAQSPATLFADSSFVAMVENTHTHQLILVGKGSWGGDYGKTQTKGLFPRKAGFWNKWEYYEWQGNEEKRRDTRGRPRLLCNVVQGHSYLRV